MSHGLHSRKSEHSWGIAVLCKSKRRGSQEELAEGGDFRSESQRLARGWPVQLQGKGAVAKGRIEQSQSHRKEQGRKLQPPPPGGGPGAAGGLQEILHQVDCLSLLLKQEGACGV